MWRLAQRTAAAAPNDSLRTASAPFTASALVTLCVIGPVVMLLLQRMPLQIYKPLTTETPGAIPVAVPLSGGTYPTTSGTNDLHRLRLVTPNVTRLLAHSELHLLVATYDTSPQLQQAEIRILGTDCVFSTRPRATFPNNDYLAFVRGDRCRRLSGTPTGALDLSVTLADPAKLAVWAYQQPATASPDPDALYTHVVPTSASASHIVRGRLVESYATSRFRRVDLLAYVWNVRPAAGWIWLAVAVAAALAWVGNLGLWRERRYDRLATECLARAASAAALAASLGLLYAIMVPPFHAADEPNHFVGFGAFTKRAGLDVDTVLLAQRGHFERIQFHPDEKFGPADLEKPGAPWTEGGEPSTEIRGAGVRLLWRAVSPLMSTLPVSHLLLALRLTNVAVFSAAVACFVALTLLLTRVPRPHLLAYPLFFVPTIPFFAMHVSNYALLLCAYVLLSAGVAVWFVDGRRSWAAGALVGLGWTAAVLVSRSALPLAPIAAAVFVGRLLLGGREQGTRAALFFWGGASIGAVLAVSVADPAYLRTVSEMMRSAGATLASTLLDAVTGTPIVLLLAGAFAAGAELGIGKIRARVGTFASHRSRKAVVWTTTTVGAAAIIAMLVTSLFTEYPTLEVIDPNVRPAATEYVRNTVLTAITMFRLTKPDLLTSWSFWGGFGWIDTLPDPRFVTMLVAATAASLVTLLLWIRRREEVRRLALLSAVCCGVVASIAAYALSVVTLTPADIHGRYLMGAYLPFLVVCWSVVAVIPRWPRWTLALTSAAVHGYCLALILRRYF